MVYCKAQVARFKSVDPEGSQIDQYNITSWFVKPCGRKLRKDANVRAILSYDDSAYRNRNYLP